jgi:hypothetical protein
MLNSTHGQHRGHSYTVAYHSTLPRADVTIYGPAGRNYAFELAVLNPEAARLGDRLAATVRAWIDGAINEAAPLA